MKQDVLLVVAMCLVTDIKGPSTDAYIHVYLCSICRVLSIVSHLTLFNTIQAQINTIHFNKLAQDEELTIQFMPRILFHP